MKIRYYMNYYYIFVTGNTNTLQLLYKKKTPRGILLQISNDVWCIYFHTSIYLNLFTFLRLYAGTNYIMLSKKDIKYQFCLGFIL